MHDPRPSEEHQLFERLREDAYFADWVRPERLLTRDDVTRAIHEVLGRSDGPLAPLPGSEERAMRRLVLFQIVMPHIGAAPVTWSDLMGELSPEEVGEVERLLGDESLGDLLG